MDHNKMKQVADLDAARAFMKRSPLELEGMLHFMRQCVVDAEWEIVRAQQSKAAYEAVVEKLEDAKRDQHRHDLKTSQQQ